MLHYLFNIFVILFFYAENDLYENSWIKVNTDSSNYPFHKDNAARVFDIKEKFCTKNKDDSTNVAYIGISVSTGEKVSSFPICKRVICSSHTSDVYTEDTKSKMVVIPDLIIPSQPDGYNPMMAESSVERKFFAFIKLLSKLQTKDRNTYQFYTFITKIINYSKMVNKNLDQISGHDSTIDDLLKLFLHCEQIILLHILNNTILFQDVLKTNRETIPDVGKIQKITLDIITYNDMCPKCFATCECFFDELKDIIIKNLFSNNNAGDIPFQIVISSLQPYEIKKETFTRKSIKKPDDQNKKIEFDIILDAELKHFPGNEEDIQGKIIQFVNPWLMEFYFENIFKKLQISVNEAKSLEELDVLHNKIISLKNYTVGDGVDFQSLYDTFHNKYSELLNKSLQPVLKISSYDQLLLDTSTKNTLLDISIRILQDTLNKMQDTSSNNRYQQEEFEHNNNTDTKKE